MLFDVQEGKDKNYKEQGNVLRRCLQLLIVIFKLSILKVKRQSIKDCLIYKYSELS